MSLIHLEKDFEWKSHGNIENLIEKRKNGVITQVEKHGVIRMAAFHNLSPNSENEHWKRYIEAPLLQNKMILSLLRMKTAQVEETFFIEDDTLYANFKTPTQLRKFFDMEEIITFKQDGDHILVKRSVKGTNKIGKYLPAIFATTIENNYHSRISDYINAEIENSKN